MVCLNEMAVNCGFLLISCLTLIMLIVHVFKGKIIGLITHTYTANDLMINAAAIKRENIDHVTHFDRKINESNRLPRLDMAEKYRQQMKMPTTVCTLEWETIKTIVIVVIIKSYRIIIIIHLSLILQSQITGFVFFLSLIFLFDVRSLYDDAMQISTRARCGLCFRQHNEMDFVAEEE